MLIFTLPSWYKTKQHPENSIFIYEQMLELKKLGHEIVVLSVQPVGIQSLRKANCAIERVNDHGIITFYTEINVIQPSKFRYLYTFTFRKALKKLIDHAMAVCGKPDVFYAHFSFAAGYAMVGQKYNIPLVVEEHYSGLMEKPDRKLRKIVKETVAYADQFICVSEGLRTAVNEIAGENSRMCVISNMINPCFTYHDLPERDVFVFFSLGSLINRKGFDVLIQAFAEEFPEEKNIQLRIGGSGAEYTNLVNLIQRFGMEDRIRLVGQLTREQTLSEYINCNCFALASRAETYGLVYREAMAVGRPIVSTRHGGFSQELPAGDGLLIDIDDIGQLRWALRRVYESYHDYDLRNISRNCLLECSPGDVSKKIADTLQSSVSNG